MNHRISSPRIKGVKVSAIMYLPTIIALFTTVQVALASAIGDKNTPKTCIVPAAGNSSIDDTPAVLQAFSDCGHGGRILLQNTTYHINSVMNTTGLEDVEIDLRGTLLVDITPLTKIPIPIPKVRYNARY